MTDDTYNAVKILLTIIDSRFDVIADEKDANRRITAAKQLRSDVVDLVTAIGILTTEIIDNN